MNTPLLAGLFGAWTAAQIALGGFFLQAYFARRKQAEYLLFGILCFSLAATDGGLTLAYAASGLEHWNAASMLANVGAVASTALNLHFVAAYTGSRLARRLVPYMYGAAAAFSVAIVAGSWWAPGSLHLQEMHRFGVPIRQVVATLTPIAVSGYSVLLLAGGVSLRELFVAYRGGKREARGAVLGHAFIVLCAVNDILSVAGAVPTPSVMPYGFLIYGFGVADTLLVRYRRAADELELTATELRQATEALTNSYLELSIVQEELFRKKQLASVGELAASIAHEVRNPLAIISNAAASLKRSGIGPEDRNTLIAIVEEEITRLNGLVTELLRFARPMNVRREDLHLFEVVRAMKERLGDRYFLDTNVPEGSGAGTVWADASLFRLAMQNIVDNAKQAMPEGGPIVVAARRDNVGGQEGVVVEVHDEGHGMDSQTLRRAMDPFFSTRPSGTGLGLPIVGRIAEAHGGRVDVKSRVGEGTTVSLFIPDRRPDQRREEAAARA
ncbi:MAG TPA: ATP-binding protein [Polyangiaceae bacterium]|nr:ATP-binding protein [Polyangiaceae bacterium]